MIISFGHTTDALIAGEKTVTRRSWSPRHASMFRTGQLVDAYDRSPRVHGQKVAVIRIVREPYCELFEDFPFSDVASEGFVWMARTGREMPPVPWLQDEAAYAWSGYRSVAPLHADSPLVASEAERAFCRAMHRAIRHVVGPAVWVVRFELVEVVGA